MKNRKSNADAEPHTRRTKMAEMSTDDFLTHGLDSDLEDAEAANSESSVTSKPVKPPKLRKPKTKPGNKISGSDLKLPPKLLKKSPSLNSEEAEHAAQMMSLKDKDPEFYKFLLANEPNLLDFHESDDSGTEENGNEEAPLQEASKSSEEASADNAEEDEEAEMDSVGHKSLRPKKVVTPQMISKWKAGLEARSIKTLKVVMHAYHSAVLSVIPAANHDGTEDAVQKKEDVRYKVEGGSALNNLVTMCLRHTVPTLELYLNYSKQKQKKGKRAPLPSSSKQWKSVKATVKVYLMDSLQMLRQLTDDSMLSVILRHALNLCPYYSCFPKVAKVALKRFVRMWSSAEEHVRVLAFMCIRRLTILVPNLFEFTMKKLYVAYVRHCKFVTPKVRPSIAFMQNSLVEMFGHDTVVTYQHAFVYIRQLAIHLRNAIASKKKDSFQAVYNWQFMCCLQLWARVVGDLFCEVLRPLVYPIVQITFGVLRLIPSARWYPLRFQCVRILNQISRSTQVYIPIASCLVEVLESAEFQKKPTSTAKPPDFSSLLKISKSQLHTKGVQDYVVEQVYALLLEHFCIFSSSIGFPELTFPICHRLKRLIKTSKVAKMNKDMKHLVDKLQERGNELSKRRDSVTFCPKDIELVRSWESEQASQPNCLLAFYETWKKLQESSDRAAAGRLEDIEKEEPVKRKRKMDQVNGKAKRMRADGVEATATSAKKKRSATHLPRNGQIAFAGDEDVLEDFVLSEDER